MSRLSRTHQLPRWLTRSIAAIAVVVFLVFAAFSIYIFILNRRLTRELVNHSWRAPTVIVSMAHQAPVRVATLYGVDWRTTPPGTIAGGAGSVSAGCLAPGVVRVGHAVGVTAVSHR